MAASFARSAVARASSVLRTRVDARVGGVEAPSAFSSPACNQLCVARSGIAAAAYFGELN